MNYIPDAISVVIPTYNRAHLIKECIQSVLEQTFLPYEIIIVDDFSTDNTKDVVNSFNSPLIKFVKNQRKKGANGARNTGILMAKGEYIAFQDSDDLFFNNKLELQLDIMRNNRKIGLCFCSLKKENGGLLSRSIVPNKKIETDRIADLLKLHNWISTQTIMVRSELAKEIQFNETLKRFQDWDFVLRFSKKFKIFHLDEPLVLQKINSTSITVNTSYFEAYEKIYALHPELVDHDIWNKIVSNQLKYNKNRNFMLFMKIFFMKVFAKIKSLF